MSSLVQRAPLLCPREVGPTATSYAAHISNVIQINENKIRKKALGMHIFSVIITFLP